MRFGCDPALDARRVTGAGRISVAPHFNALPHFLLAGKLCRGIGDFVWREQPRCWAVTIRIPPHTRLLAITEEFEFHPGLPGWNFFYPKCGMGDARAKCPVWRPLGRKSFAGRIMLGAFAWTPPDRGGLEFGHRSGRSGLAGCATAWPGGPLLGLLRLSWRCSFCLRVARATQSIYDEEELRTFAARQN